MKKLIYSILFVSTALLFTNCSDDDQPIFVADLGSEEIAFQNTFASEYLLSKETEDNIADRFIWNETTLGTNNDYELQAAIDELFENPMSIGITTDTNYPVMVSQLLDLAEQLGLDDDPETTDPDGNPNNTGVVYFRVKSTIGNGGAGTEEIISTTQSININWIEKVVEGTDCDPIWVVGGAIANVGWNFDLSTVCDAGVQRVKASFVNDIFRFFEVEGDWGTGLNYAYYEDKGYDIDANFESEGEGDFNFKFIGTPGIYELVIDDNLKTIVLYPSSSLWAVGGAVPGGWNFNDDTIELVEGTPDIWSASITMSTDIFRFFQTFGEWDTNNNYKYYEDEGYTIDSKLESEGEGDFNFVFVGTPGTYIFTINAIEKTITLE